LSNTYSERHKRDLSNESSKSLLINKNFNVEYPGEEDINSLDFRDYENINILDQKSNLGNSNSNNISSLNITCINNAEENRNLTLKDNNNAIYKINPINENIKNNKLILCESDINTEKKKNKDNYFFTSTANNQGLNDAYDKSKEIQNKSIIITNNHSGQNQDHILLPNPILNVSDLDIQLEEEVQHNQKNSSNNTIWMLKNINSQNGSFVNFKNNLKTKYDLDDNKTNSYLMALNGYTDIKDDDKKEELDFNEKIDKDYCHNTKHKNGNQSENIHIKNVLIDNFDYNNEEDGQIFNNYNNDWEKTNNNYFVTSNASIYNLNKEDTQNHFKSSNNILNTNKNNEINEYDVNNKNNNSENHRNLRQNNQQQQGHSRSKSQEVSYNNFGVPIVIFLKIKY